MIQIIASCSPGFLVSVLEPKLVCLPPPTTQVEVQSLLVAEVVGGAKKTAQKSSLKSLERLWEQVSPVSLHTPQETLAGRAAVVLTVGWCQTEPRTGGPVHQHPAGSGAEQRHLSGPAGGVPGLLQRPQGQGHHREAQGEVTGGRLPSGLSGILLDPQTFPVSVPRVPCWTCTSSQSS